ncbi:MFS transporter [Mycolicibacterium poriferae]|uniref:MFS transporter n=1 Tax=Mycolicibacterium poriferae TaxID=39694 RepID=A0A6N4V5K8_9MYCO|nr:MFS transporter [Mycolicibacterium poriferae]
MTRRWFALGVLTMAVLIIGVDGTVLALAMPFISADLSASGTQLLWIGDIYSFVLAALLISMGSLGDRIGHKKLLLCGATLFGIVSAITAYSSSPEMLIATRALLGLAGATLAPATLALIRGLFPDQRERSIAVGIWASAFSAGAALGPVIGGVLLEHFWWGSVFLINIPAMVVLVVGGLVLLPEHRNPEPGPWDLPSVGLSMVGMLGVVYAIKEGIAAAAHGLRIDAVLAALLGAAALTLFVRRQLRLPVPLIDVRLFRRPVFTGVVVANLLSVLGLSGLVFFLSQYFQLVRGYGPLQAGLAELPAAVTATVFGVLAGIAVRYVSHRLVLTAGLTLVGVAMGTLMAFLLLISPISYLPLGITLFVVGVGLGLAFTVASDVILASVPPQRAGSAAAVSETAYELGMALGIATLGSILTAVYRTVSVPPSLPGEIATQARDSLPSAIHAAQSLPAEQAERLLDPAREAFTHGLAVASGVGAALLLSAAVAVWWLLRTHPVSPGVTEVGVLTDPGVHGDPSGDGGVDAARRAELCDRHRRIGPNLHLGGDARPLLPEDQQAVPRQDRVLDPCGAGDVVHSHDHESRTRGEPQ